MKLKCNDGIVRDFEPTRDLTSENGGWPLYSESRCKSCGEYFGVHDTKVLKPEWKKHACKIAKIVNNVINPEFKKELEGFLENTMLNVNKICEHW